MLVAAADKAGVPGAAELLADESGCLAEVRQLLTTRARGINGVPFFVVQGR